MRILIADDNKFVRRGITGLLATDSRCEICGEASDGVETLQQVKELNPDLVLLDVSMPGTDGLETARRLRQQAPDLKILIMSQHDPSQLSASAIEAGAAASLDKSRIATDLLPTVRRMFNL